MNEALWLVYFGGVAEALQAVFGIVAVVGSVACILAGMISSSDGDLKEVWPYIRRGIPWIVASGLVAVVMPSKHVLYVAAGIAASQEAASTEVGGKALGALNKYLDEYLSDQE